MGQWAMLSMGEQMALRGNRTNPSLVAARFLLKPGLKYEEAVKTLAPYERVKKAYPEARQSGRVGAAADRGFAVTARGDPTAPAGHAAVPRGRTDGIGDSAK